MLTFCRIGAMFGVATLVRLLIDGVRTRWLVTLTAGAVFNLFLAAFAFGSWRRLRHENAGRP